VWRPGAANAVASNHFGYTVCGQDTTNHRVLIRPIDWPVAFKLQVDIAKGGTYSGNVRRYELGGVGESGLQFLATNTSKDCDAKTGDVVMGGIAPTGNPFFEGGAVS
jgi:hypothetical protein